MTSRAIVVVAVLALGLTDGFNAPSPLSSSPLSKIASGSRPWVSSPLFHSHDSSNKLHLLSEANTIDDCDIPTWKRFLNRFDTTTAAGIEDAKGAGLVKRIKGLHGPITYLALALLAGLKWKWCFRSPLYWFGVAFCIKWYRARYVFKIPVWDRQPNWNNIITSKEQEKDLKAFTCKQCGSTLFIAKTREFFFEGNTGIGGLGCFSCGAKGKENFVMDRDRIVEDVSDMDDYFEYERPLDFVSAAERRKVLKEAGGDEDKANQLLVERSALESDGDDQQQPPSSESPVNGSDKDGGKAEQPEAAASEAEDKEEEESKPKIKAETTDDPPKKKKKKKSTSKPKKAKKPTPPAPASDDDLDFLDMDAF